jgi:hypothetical protein
MMIATNSIAAISESAWSNFLDRGAAVVASIGDMTQTPSARLLPGLPRLVKINPWLSAMRRSKPACLSASARRAPGGISRAFWRASTAIAFWVRLAGEACCFMTPSKICWSSWARSFVVHRNLRHSTSGIPAPVFAVGLENQLSWIAFELLYPAIVQPKFHIVTVDHFAGTFPCTVVVIADEIDGFHEMAVTANKVRSIVRHDRGSLTQAI